MILLETWLIFLQKSVIEIFTYLEIMCKLCLQIDLHNFILKLKPTSYFNSCRFLISFLMIEKNIKIHKSKKLSLHKLWKLPWKILEH